MAVQPNSVCDAFCTWLLATPWLNITAPQTDIIDEIQAAAQAPSTVTEHLWNEFLRTTGGWYKYYQAYIDQTTTPQGEWIDFTTNAAVTGFSATTTNDFRYMRIGNTYYINVQVSGTSNATTITFTLPAVAAASSTFLNAVVVNNGVVPTTSGRVIITAASDQCLCKRDAVSTNFTNSGAKAYFTEFFFEV